MMEKEYIERNEFKKYWNKEFRHLYPNDKYLVALANFPTADVVEVRHGHWIDTDKFDSFITPIYQCSECWKEVADNYIKYHKYCLHCGAKMDGKDEKND